MEAGRHPRSLPAASISCSSALKGRISQSDHRHCLDRSSMKGRLLLLHVSHQPCQRFSSDFRPPFEALGHEKGGQKQPCLPTSFRLFTAKQQHGRRRRDGGGRVTCCCRSCLWNMYFFFPFLSFLSAVARNQFRHESGAASQRISSDTERLGCAHGEGPALKCVECVSV